jgi:hypothetical protein
MKHLCTLLIAVALLCGTGYAQSIPTGTYVYSGQASNGHPLVFTAVVTPAGLNYTETIDGGVLCSATMQVETIDPSGTVFTYKTTTPGASDCTLGQDFIFMLTVTPSVIEFKKGEGPVFNLNLQ